MSSQTPNVLPTASETTKGTVGEDPTEGYISGTDDYSLEDDLHPGLTDDADNEEDGEFTSDDNHLPSVARTLHHSPMPATLTSPMPPRFKGNVIRPNQRRISKYVTFGQIFLFVAILCLTDIATKGALQQSLIPLTSSIQDTFQQVQSNASGLLLTTAGRIVQPSFEESRIFATFDSIKSQSMAKVSSNIVVAVGLSMLVFVGGNYIRMTSSSSSSSTESSPILSPSTSARMRNVASSDSEYEQRVRAAYATGSRGNGVRLPVGTK